MRCRRGNSYNSSSNTFSKNTASGNWNDGFGLNDSSGNKLTSNTADGNVNSQDGYGVGFYLYSFATKNNYTSNTADGNGYYGYKDYSTGSMGPPTYAACCL